MSAGPCLDVNKVGWMSSRCPVLTGYSHIASRLLSNLPVPDSPLCTYVSYIPIVYLVLCWRASALILNMKLPPNMRSPIKMHYMHWTVDMFYIVILYLSRSYAAWPRGVHQIPNIAPQKGCALTSRMDANVHMWLQQSYIPCSKSWI